MGADPGRAIVLATDDALIGTIESELANLEITLQVARVVGHAVSALVEDPPPRAQVLVADFDALSPGDVVQLHQVRERGWFGAIIALGHVPPEFSKSLVLHRILPRPIAADALRKAVAAIGLTNRTRRISTLRPQRR